MLVSFLFGFYFSVLLSFSFVSHPVYYCLLLLVSSLNVCGIVFWLVGFSWYVVLLCLVYIGGVYILFLFVSVFSPNTIIGSGIGVVWLFLVFFFSLWLYSLGFFMDDLVYVEYSTYLCSSLEGFTYIIFCLTLVLGFVCVSVVVNRKDSFYR